MPSRRTREAIAAALSGAGGLLGNLAQIQLQNKLITDRQRALIEENQRGQRQSALVTSGLSRTREGGDVDLDALAELTESDPEFLASLMPSPEQRLGPITERIQGATSRAALPTEHDIRGLSRALGVEPDADVESGLPFAGLPPLSDSGLPSIPLRPATPAISGLLAQRDARENVLEGLESEAEERTVRMSGDIAGAQSRAEREVRREFPELEGTVAQQLTREMLSTADDRRAQAGQPPLTIEEKIRTAADVGRELSTTDETLRDVLLQLQADEITRNLQGLTPVQANQADRLAQQFIQASSEFQEQARFFRVIQRGVDDPSAVGDVGMIFAFVKVNDPGSTVRDSERDLIENVGSLPLRAQVFVQRLATGQSITPEIRRQMLAEVSGIMSDSVQVQRALKSNFESRASTSGIPPESVTIDYETAFLGDLFRDATPEPSGPVAPGTTLTFDPATGSFR